MIHAIVTTFDAVLKISVDLSQQTLSSEVIDQKCGIYFGLTRCAGQLLLAARNLDINRNIKSVGIPTNTIYRFDRDLSKIRPIIYHECLKDLHQLRAIGRWLCVVLGEGSKIVVFERGSWRLTREIDLARHVPLHLRHGGPQGHESDDYHFNSIYFTKTRAFVLAHNWNRESFAMEFFYSIDSDGPCYFRLAAVYEQLGSGAHDVIHDDNILYVSDSQGGRLIARGATERSFGLLNDTGRPFPRGLSLTTKHLLVCYGHWSKERADRSNSNTRLCILHRRSLLPAMDVEIGPYGNSCDILVISEKDLSDEIHHGQRWQDRLASPFVRRSLSWPRF
jgi:hypothetical protein